MSVTAIQSDCQWQRNTEGLSLTEEYGRIVSDRNTDGLSVTEEYRGIVSDRGIQRDY